MNNKHIYTHFDPEFVEKFWEVLDRMGRTTAHWYDGKCQKEVFVRRTLHKWFNTRYIVAILNEGTDSYTGRGYSDYKEVKLRKKHRLYVGGWRYVLGHGEEISVYINKPCTAKFFDSITLNQYNMGGMTFCEISKEEYEEYASLFEDDRPEYEWTVQYIDWKETTKDGNYDTVMARDKTEAIENYEKQFRIKREDGPLKGEYYSTRSVCKIELTENFVKDEQEKAKA